MTAWNTRRFNASPVGQVPHLQTIFCGTWELPSPCTRALFRSKPHSELLRGKCKAPLRCCDLSGGSELPWPQLWVAILAAEPESKLGSVFPLASAGFRVRDGASEARLMAPPSVLLQQSAFPKPKWRFGGLALGRMLCRARFCLQMPCMQRSDTLCCN